MGESNKRKDIGFLMYIPIIKKITKNNDVLIERSLPKVGELVATVGEEVEPYTKLGMSKVSYGVLPLTKRFKLAKRKKSGNYFYTGDLIGFLNRKRVIAPFDGTLFVDEQGVYSFQQEDRDFWLLSGVWGQVVSVIEKKSALIKTQTIDLNFAACTDNSFSGELIVFPNPSELLEMQYLHNFSKDSFGKIIYIGDHIGASFVDEAAKLGVAGLIAGSVEREAMAVAKKNKIFLGSISGFGVIPTPKFIFDVLKEVSNRYVFLIGGKGILRIPSAHRFEDKEVKSNTFTGQLRSVKKGLLVQIFEEPYFGWVGHVHSVQSDYIRVIIDQGRDPVKVKIPNVFSLE